MKGFEGEDLRIAAPQSALVSMAMRRNLALGLRTATIVLAVLAIFYQDLSIVASDALHSDTTSHILAIPFLLCYLIYRKRKMIGASITFETNWPAKGKRLETVGGILLSTAAVALYWYGSYTFTPLEFHILSLPMLIAGLVLLLFDLRTLRQLIFPIAFLTFLTPPPSQVLYGLGSTLSIIGSEVAHSIVRVIGVSCVISSEYGNPTIIVVRPDGTELGFTVDIACSGIHSLIGFLIFAVFIAYIERGKAWKKAAILLTGLPLIYLLNIVRITATVLMGYQYGEELALQVFHLTGGLILTFLGTLMLLSIAEKLFKAEIFTRTQLEPCRKCIGQAVTGAVDSKEVFCSDCGRLLRNSQARLGRSDIAKAATIAAVTSLLLSIQVPVFALTEGPAEILIQTTAGELRNTEILPRIPGYTSRFIYRDRNFESLAKQDASLLYAYMPLDEKKDPVWVSVEIAPRTGHRWEYCLIGWSEEHGYQPRARQLDLKDVRILQNPPVIARFFAFQYVETNMTQVVLYWYETSLLFMTNSTSQQKQIKVSVIMFPQTPQEIEEDEKVLLLIAEAIANNWQPVKEWSQFAMTMAQHGAYILGASTISLILATVFQAVRRINRKRSNLTIYWKLAPEEKLIIKAVSEASKDRPTLQNIAAESRELTGKQIDLDVLHQRLIEAQKAGMLKRDLANVADEPVLVWKSLVPL